ncbi:glycoside hydrolase family 3 N-terminal domain-containing protein [Allorhizocola rhizosphaerae]|uniref:glycoside hydrolase family 3 N-terminal domain-containing protein n=1 Tax=Allorhizocola rhizosphaerae TaxID=1872709 RepID=UPI000E3E1811|nr:glycoside hydrolase family 3 N-terminal domain-containing protein [Allorhizocola rhizosphaerae]
MTIDPDLRRLAMRTLLAAFPGHSAPAWATDLLEQGLAGYTLFGYNIIDHNQVAKLSGQLRAARPNVLLAIDEEGGDVTRLAHRTGSPYPGNAALGAIGDLDLTRRVYQAIGTELAEVGLNLNLAPTVDVNTATDNPIIGTRSFGDDPVKVAGHAAAAVVGLQQAGVAACAKHFPGHGATTTDSHLELPTVDVSPAVLRQRELPPFAAVVAADAKAIMTAHIRVPSLTGDDPATFNSGLLVDLLRGEFGFAGAVVTDALEMKGASLIAGSIERAAIRALQAGADLLCIGAEVDLALIERIAASIVDAMVSGELKQERVEEAADRCDALAAWSMGAASVAPAPRLGYEAAKRAVAMEGSLAGFESPMVVQLYASHTIAEGRVPWGLAPHMNGTPQMAVVASETSAEALIEAAQGRPIVLVGRHVHRNPATRTLTERLAAVHPVAVVEMGWPSGWRPAGVRAFITTYGASHANGRAAAELLGLAH